jgi:hypothetical protein
MTLKQLLVLEIVHLFSVPMFLQNDNKTWIIAESNEYTQMTILSVCSTLGRDQ